MSSWSRCEKPKCSTRWPFALTARRRWFYNRSAGWIRSQSRLCFRCARRIEGMVK